MIALLVAVAALAQNKETRSLSSFTEISVHEGIDVYLKKGSKEEARIEAEGVDLDDVLTEVNGDELKIHLDRNWGRGRADVTVWVTYKSLRAVTASSAGSVEGENPIKTSGDFEVSASSAGEVRLEISAQNLEVSASSAGDAILEVDVQDVDARVNSAGDIEIEGSAQNQDVRASSSGDYDGYDLQSKTADVSVSSGGSIRISVSEQLDARASSGGSIRYKGNPRMDVSTSSGGSVKKS